jgi:protein-S-isoprenylcysteine O-methyltransferase
MGEFTIKFTFFPSWHSDTILIVGITVVLLAQCVRSLAMRTCGESFNHLIQTSKKDNHVLVKHGM